METPSRKYSLKTINVYLALYLQLVIYSGLSWAVFLAFVGLILKSGGLLAVD